MQIFKNWGKIGEEVIRFLSRTNLILLFRPQITVQISSKSNQNCSRRTDRLREWQTRVIL